MTRPHNLMTKALYLSALFVAAIFAAPAVNAADTDIVINEVYYLGNSASNDWIEIKNTGSSTIDVGDWWLCARFSYGRLSSMTVLSGDLNLGPGEIAVVQSWTNLDNTASDLGLYTTSSFASPSAMIDFVQWGTSADVGRPDVAGAKGVWSETSPGVYDFVATASAELAAAYDGENSGGGLLTLSADFANVAPTQGGENTTVPVELTSWGRIKALFDE